MNLVRTISGIKWSVIISVASTSAYLVINTILAKIDHTSALLGQFAAMVIAINLITTFLFFGSSNTIIHFYHTLKKDEKQAFLYTHLRNISVFAIITTLFFLIFPQAISKINPLYKSQTVILFVPLVIYMYVSSYETARMNYKKGVILDKLHHFIFLFITLAIAINYYFGVETNNILDLYTCGLLAAVVLVICKNRKFFADVFQGFQQSSFAKKNYYRYMLITQANSILAFLFMYLDQLVIGQKLGIQYMGIFFLFTQIAMLVKYVPMQFNKTLLSSFSAVLAKGTTRELNELYFLLFKNIILVSATITICVYFFAKDVISYVNPEYIEHISVLHMLLIANLIGSVGSMNSMLVISLNKIIPFLFLNFLIGMLNVLLILHVDLNFLENFAQIKIIVTVIAQVGLLYLIRKSITINAKIISLMMLVVLVITMIYLELDPYFHAKLALVLFMLVGLFIILRKDYTKAYKIN